MNRPIRTLGDVLLALWIIVWVVGSTWLACMLGCGCSPIVTVRGNLGACVHSRVRGSEPPRLNLESHAP
jgi:hypothetical protein